MATQTTVDLSDRGTPGADVFACGTGIGCGAVAVACAGVGAKTALLMYADGDVAQALQRAGELDRAATEALVARLFPGLDVVAAGDGTLDRHVNPPEGMVYAGVFPGLTLICAAELGEIRPSRLRPGWLAEGAGRRVILHSMHSASDFLGFAVWNAEATLDRALCLSPGYGIVEDSGDRLPFEQPYWAGQNPVEPDDDDEEPYPLPFHPLDLGEDALAALCGFVIEGTPPHAMPDLSRVPLAGFRLGVPTLTLQLSHGRPIAQPSALDVQEHLRRLGNGLDYLIVDRGRENYLQVAVGGRQEIPAGMFRVERREGGPDLHFRCEVDALDEVAEIFRGYLLNQDGWGDRHWEQVWL